MGLLDNIEQAGANLLNDVKQWVMPTPQWILTPKAEAGLEKLGKLEETKNFFQKTVAETNKAYASILPNTLANMTNAAFLVILAIIVILLYLVFRRQ